MSIRSVFVLLLITCAGCVPDQPANPSFLVTVDRARSLLAAAERHPVTLARPLVIIGGFADPGIAAYVLSHRLQAAVGDQRVVSVSLGLDSDFSDFRRRIIDAVDHAFPSNDPNLTTRVDVVGFSMGGLAAQYASCPAISGEPARRLNIARLFTISSPLSGAIETLRVPSLIEPFQKNMTPGSRFLSDLTLAVAAGEPFPVYSYVCLQDRVVGPQYAATPGKTAWWVSAPVFFSAHNFAFFDPRILADIAARLRSEPPLATDPPAPLPAVPKQPAY